MCFLIRLINYYPLVSPGDNRLRQIYYFCSFQQKFLPNSNKIPNRDFLNLQSVFLTTCTWRSDYARDVKAFPSRWLCMCFELRRTAAWWQRRIVRRRRRLGDYSELTWHLSAPHKGISKRTSSSQAVFSRRGAKRLAFYKSPPCYNVFYSGVVCKLR